MPHPADKLARSRIMDATVLLTPRFAYSYQMLFHLSARQPFDAT